MRKVFVSLLLFLAPFASYAQSNGEVTDVVLESTHIDKEDEEKPRTTFFAPPVTLHIDGHRFSWGSQFSFCGIELLAEDGVVVFSQPLSGMESSVSIPETLSGTFTIVMYLGDIVYMGEVTI